MTWQNFITARLTSYSRCCRILRRKSDWDGELDDDLLLGVRSVAVRDVGGNFVGAEVSCTGRAQRPKYAGFYDGDKFFTENHIGTVN